MLDGKNSEEQKKAMPKSNVDDNRANDSDTNAGSDRGQQEEDEKKT